MRTLLDEWWEVRIKSAIPGGEPYRLASGRKRVGNRPVGWFPTSQSAHAFRKDCYLGRKVWVVHVARYRIVKG